MQQDNKLIKQLHGPGEGATSSHTSINSNEVLTVGVDETATKLQVIATFNQSLNKQVKATVVLKEIPSFSAPALVDWNDQVATWDAVENAVGYRVTLFKDGQQQGASIEVKDLEYDFSETMKDSGVYTFTVVALGDGLNILDSLPATSSSIVVTKEDLDESDEKPEDNPIPGGDSGGSDSEGSEETTKPEEKSEQPGTSEFPETGLKLGGLVIASGLLTMTIGLVVSLKRKVFRK